MKVLWVFAHPERQSLSSALRDVGIEAVKAAGHEAQTSDLYAMNWKATIDRTDFCPEFLPDEHVTLAHESKRAHEAGTLSEDIKQEQAKLDWADTIVLQFPLWWYGMPAILKGWFDRVFVKGYAYGVVDPDNPGRTLRYGEGKLTGKRAQVITTTGSPEAPLGPRGINGQLDQVLFPLLHGTLWYVGIDPLPPIAIYSADHLDQEQYGEAAALVQQTVANLENIEPIRYRYQNGGDYDEDLVLRPEHSPNQTGLAVHTISPVTPITRPTT